MDKHLYELLDDDRQHLATLAAGSDEELDTELILLANAIAGPNGRGGVEFREEGGGGYWVIKFQKSGVRNARYFICKKVV